MVKEEEKKKQKEKIKKKVSFLKSKKNLSEHSRGAQRATIVLFVLILLSIISGIFTFYLYEPSKEIYISESQMQKEIRNIYDYEPNSEERANQEARAQEAQVFYGSIMDKYTSNENAVIKAYAGLHSNFIKTLIALTILLPFIAIAIMFIGSPINFIFAILNMIFVVPFKATKYLFNSFRSEKSSKRKSSKHQLKLEAAN